MKVQTQVKSGVAQGCGCGARPGQSHKIYKGAHTYGPPRS